MPKAPRHCEERSNFNAKAFDLFLLAITIYKCSGTVFTTCHSELVEEHLILFRQAQHNNV